MVAFVYSVNTTEGTKMGTRNESTNETCPFHIWASEVEAAALAKGRVDFGDLFRQSEIRARLTRAWNAGEPVWMVADEMWLRARGRVMAIRESKDGLSLIRRAVGR